MDNNNNTSDSMENKKYRGVLRRKGGTFNATIGSRKKGSGSGVWLGSFRTAIEAAKAYDKAAIKMYGTKAILNFPTAIPIEESNDTDAVAPRAKRKHPSDALAVAPKPKRKQPSARASGSSISQHSRQVGLRNDKVKRDYFKWTDEFLVVFCTILKKHIDVNNENSQSQWDDLKLEVEEVVQHKFNTVTALRSKYDKMTKRYKLWKLLKEGESGLRWNKTTQKLDFSDDWWESKIKENPEFIQILKRQPSKELQKAWHLLYEDVVSNGVNSVSSLEDANKSNETPCTNPEDGVESVAAPSVDPKKSNQLAFLNLESESEDEDEDEDVDGDGDEDVAVDENLDDHVQHTLHASQIGNMKTEEATSGSHFINEARQEERSDGDGSKRSQKMAKTDIKTDQNATQQSVLTSVNKVGDSSISVCISAINRLVDEGLMVSCSELWCFAVNLFEDDVKRELFISLPDDVGRLAWLQYKQNLDN